MRQISRRTVKTDEKKKPVAVRSPPVGRGDDEQNAPPSLSGRRPSRARNDEPLDSAPHIADARAARRL